MEPSREQERYEHFLELIATRQRGGRAQAELMAVAVLDALRLRLAAGEAEEMEAELPLPLRRALHRLEARGHFSRRRGKHDAPRIRTSEGFYQAVAGRLRIKLERTPQVIGSVFHAVRAELSPEEIFDVASELPADLRELWLGHAAPVPTRAPGPGVIEEEPERYETFLAEAGAGGMPGEVKVEDAARAVLGHFLRRLSGGETARLLGMFPMSLRDLLREVAPPLEAEASSFGRDELISRVAGQLVIEHEQAEALVRAVLAAARNQCTDAVVAGAAQQLPQDIRELWEGPGRAPVVPLVAVAPRQMGVPRALAYVVVGELAKLLLKVLEWLSREPSRSRPARA